MGRSRRYSQRERLIPWLKDRQSPLIVSIGWMAAHQVREQIRKGQDIACLCTKGDVPGEITVKASVIEAVQINRILL